jgi:PIN domain nuclease of toxin-antitoxin system
LLLDTHAWLWYYLGDSRLSATAHNAIADPANEKFINPASYWELASKVSLGKLVLTESYDDLIQHSIFDNGFNILPIEPRHTVGLISLPHHHRDLLDRLLVAQVTVEKMSVVSNDSLLDQYSITRIW